MRRTVLAGRTSSALGRAELRLNPIVEKAEVPFLVEGSAQDRARRGNIPKAFAFESALKAVSSTR
jgi:hypothetical protein